MLGTTLPVAGKPRRTYPRGRRCAAEGCSTILSIYNATTFCALHEGGNAP